MLMLLESVRVLGSSTFAKDIFIETPNVVYNVFMEFKL
jgi:hypothetical protein